MKLQLALACVGALAALSPSAASAAPDVEAPIVRLTSLADGVTVTDTTNVTVQAADDIGVVRIALSIDGVRVADAANASSLAYAWDTSDLVETSAHAVLAEAWDATGKRGSHAITVSVRDVSGPSVAFRSPAGNVAIAGSIDVDVAASDPSGVRQIVLSVDGRTVATALGASLAHALDVSSEPSGTHHRLQVDAYDTIGWRSTAIRDVTVVDAEAPQVEIRRPLGPEVFGLERIEVAASDDRAVRLLQLRIDGAVVHEATDTSSFVHLWDAAAAGVGTTPTIEVRASDAAGNATNASRQVSVIDENHAARGAPLGIIPSAPDASDEWSVAGFADARSRGAEVLYWYLRWTDLAERPETIAPAMQALGSGGATAVTFDLIHSTVLSKYPPPYHSFTDPGFADAFSDAAADFAARYRPAFLFVGNEANLYLEDHPDEVGAFQEVIRKTRAAVAAARPETRVGVVLNYTGAMDESRLALFRALAGEADLVGYTVYGYRSEGGEIRFDDPARGIELIEALPSLVPGKPFAVAETGWNTSARFASNESLQLAYVRLLRNHAKSSRAAFLNLFLYQDGVDCSEQALSFFDPADAPHPASPEVQELAEFLCRFGIRRADGSAKSAWSYLGQTSWPVPEPTPLAQGVAVVLALACTARRRTPGIAPGSSRRRG